MLSTGLSTIVVNYSKATPVLGWFFFPLVRGFCLLTQRHAESRAGRARLRQPDEDEQGPELLPAGYGRRRRAGEQHLRDCQDNEKIIPTFSQPRKNSPPASTRPHFKGRSPNTCQSLRGSVRARRNPKRFRDHMEHIASKGGKTRWQKKNGPSIIADYILRRLN